MRVKPMANLATEEETRIKEYNPNFLELCIKERKGGEIKVKNIIIPQTMT
jgi:hypothetical protein